MWGHCNGATGPKEFKHPIMKAHFLAGGHITAHSSFWDASGMIPKLPDKQRVASCADGASVSTVWSVCPLQTQKQYFKYYFLSLNATRNTWAALHRQVLIHLIHNVPGYWILLLSIKISGSQMLSLTLDIPRSGCKSLKNPLASLSRFASKWKPVGRKLKLVIQIPNFQVFCQVKAEPQGHWLLPVWWCWAILLCPAGLKELWPKEAPPTFGKELSWNQHRTGCVDNSFFTAVKHLRLSLDFIALSQKKKRLQVMS